MSLLGSPEYATTAALLSMIYLLPRAQAIVAVVAARDGIHPDAAGDAPLAKVNPRQALRRCYRRCSCTSAT
ncbi:hypothetical protein DSL92_03260 [Billgrantia gudaonensis]|uniref:Uncharacterized protein n=1 Tax=Billgrantia gudaonensis TaxID=376427 RepID=A0A432JJV0_9GAMM|nr:hypothetical protein DSL92_03260 [Halomonas gudaonensis]